MSELLQSFYLKFSECEDYESWPARYRRGLFCPETWRNLVRSEILGFLAAITYYYSAKNEKFHQVPLNPDQFYDMEAVQYDITLNKLFVIYSLQDKEVYIPSPAVL